MITRTDEQVAQDYRRYRGKCKETCDRILKYLPKLTLVRGHYYCVPWGTVEPHWWLTWPDGRILDPTKLQFPCAGTGHYEPFDGIVSCSNCGKEMPEEEASFESNYCFCSSRCYGAFVGVPCG